MCSTTERHFMLCGAIPMPFFFSSTDPSSLNILLVVHCILPGTLLQVHLPPCEFPLPMPQSLQTDPQDPLCESVIEVVWMCNPAVLSASWGHARQSAGCSAAGGHYNLPPAAVGVSHGPQQRTCDITRTKRLLIPNTYHSQVSSVKHTKHTNVNYLSSGRHPGTCKQLEAGMTKLIAAFCNCFVNPLNPELNPICYLLAILGAHHFLHISRIRIKLLTFRLLMSYIYIYGAPILDVSRSHTMTQHSR